MGSSPIVGITGGASDKTHGFRRVVHDNGGGGHSPTVHYLFVSFLLCSSLGVFYIFYLFNNPNLSYNNSVGCQEDNDGSWAIGAFYGDSPFSLKPIEAMNIWDNKSAAWPIANPILTCASVTDSGFPSNYVADPFLYTQDDILYMFFETKNMITMKGDIAVARSKDNGATWEQLGVVLDENWHLSHPYVFNYNNRIYMMPQGIGTRDIRLYRAIEFPFKWQLEKIILQRPLINSIIVHHEKMFWIFGSFQSRLTYGNLEIWYSQTPFGPWTPHMKNPFWGPRNGGRPVVYNGNLYRLGHDENIRVFKIELLTPSDYLESEVDFKVEKSTKGKNAWNGARSHHLDVQQLRTGQWVGFADGDRTHFGDVTSRHVVGCGLILIAGSIVFFMGWLLGFIKCFIPLTHIKKRNDSFFNWERLKLRVKVNQTINPNTYTGKFIFTLLLIISIVITCAGFGYIYGGNGSEKPYPVNDHFSQFTLLAMTYDARMWNLKMYVKHYSKCASVHEIVVVWNKGKPPNPTELESAVPVRIRVENRNSMNNRFQVDPFITTKAVLELDDDIMMNCDDLERGFKVWRENPTRLVGFYPRLVTGPPPLKYRPEKHARNHNGYNMVLTGAAFVDREFAFERYWSEEAEPGRKMVDEVFNCEDVLMNFLYANSTPGGPSVEYIKPAWAIDTSKFSGVAISGNTQAHYRVRGRCLEKFTEWYGGITDRKVGFRRRKDGWDR